ncbi:hypothetical protein BaRGS_00030151 [Batillaria attramentaria]|uniref:Cytochrome P450 n=1 Tax=Batillaria attramentaria TaxID=370345 RepID=A0ABD0JVA4_9CAEN
MNRSLVDMLRQELLCARATRQLFSTSRRKKSSAVTAVNLKTTTAAEFLHDDVTKFKPVTCPFTAARLSPSTSQSRHRSAHFTTAHTVTVPGITHDVLHPPVVDDDGDLPRRERATDSNNVDSTSSSADVPPYLAFDTARPFSEMPAPFNLPIIGTVWMHMPGGPLHGLSFEKKIMRMEELYGPIINEHVLFNFHIVHAFKPEDIEAVYRAQGTRPRRDAFRLLQKYNQLYNKGVQGIITSQGDAWHRLRSKAQVKMMKPKSASAYLDLHCGVADDFVAAIGRQRDEQGVVEDILPELYKFAMEGIGCVCFNRRLGALEADIPKDSDASRFIQAVSDVMAATDGERKGIIHKWSPYFRKLVRAQGFIRELSLREAMRTLNMRSEEGSEVDGESGDLIPYLMTKTDLTEAEVMTIISEFFFAGVDTTSHLLGFCLYMLANNPEAQEKMIQEVDQVLDGSGAISASTLGRMSYLKAVTKETFRMCPVTPGNGRTLDTDIVLSGYHVPAGLMIGLHHDIAGKNPLYVTEPDRFMPERWLRSNRSNATNVHPFVVMPFGFGPRSCVGRRFAEQEFSVALIRTLQKYRLEYAHHEALEYEMSIVNKPTTPLKFRFIERK